MRDEAVSRPGRDLEATGEQFVFCPYSPGAAAGLLTGGVHADGAT